MFKSKATDHSDQIDTLIGQQVVIRGDLYFTGGLLIEGRVIGKIVAEDGQKALLTLAQNGSIEGEVRAPVVIINGRLVGDVYASERVELESQARVEGNVHYKVVQMAAGSTLTGRLIHVDPLREDAPQQATEHEPRLAYG
ncbi:MAG: polymer-forming cytoskeletal protein [Lysobacter sp.]|nr:polymer-forming cytoskeletal protein [Lysobacter sp.]